MCIDFREYQSLSVCFCKKYQSLSHHDTVQLNVIMWFMFCILSVKWADTICLFYHFVLLRNKGDVSWSWLWLLCGVSHKAWSECWKRCHCSCQLCKMTSDLWISFCHFKLRMCYTSHMLYGSSLGHILTSCIYASKKIWRVDKRFCYYFLVSLQ